MECQLWSLKVSTVCSHFFNAYEQSPAAFSTNLYAYSGVMPSNSVQVPQFPCQFQMLTEGLNLQLELGEASFILVG